MANITDKKMQYVKPPNNSLPNSFAFTNVDAGDTIDPFVSIVHIKGITDKGGEFLMEFKINSSELIHLEKRDLIQIIMDAFADARDQGIFDVE